MFVVGFVDHLIYPFTYTTSQGDVKQLSAKDILHVALLVISGLAMATIEALCSSKSLKSSCISIVIIVCAAFYHGAAAMKIAHICVEPEASVTISMKVDISQSDIKQAAPRPPQESVPEVVASKVVLHSNPIQVSSTSVSALPESNVTLASSSHATQSPTPPASVVAAEEEPRQVIPQRKPYKELAPTEAETVIIGKMISTIGDTYTPLLYLKKTDLIQWGSQLAHIHPLKFLETVLNNPALKQSMRYISAAWLKWNGFLEGEAESPGFAWKCQNADKAGNFAPYLPDFCAAVKVDLEKARPLVEAKKWAEFIRFLIKS